MKHQKPRFRNRIPTIRLAILFSLIFTVPATASEKDIKEYGAVGDGKTDDTKAVQMAIDEASKNHDKLVFSSGTYLTGMIFLKSNVEIEIQQGAIWKALPDLDVFPEINSSADISQKDGYTMSKRSFIFADNVENVTLSGHGTIYPNGDSYDAFPMGEEFGSKRPYGIYFRNSKNISITDLHLRNSAFWMLRLYLCDDVKIRGIDLYNHANTNNDGIDIVDCHRVTVSDCVIDTSDDALCLKTEAPKGTEDVVITNCILSSTASALKLGTGSFGSFKRILASNIVIRPTRSEKVVHVLQIKDGISGIGVMSADGADIEDIRFSNISISGVQAPIFVRLNERHKVTHAEYSTIEITPGTINGIHFSNINTRNCGPVSANIAGYPGHYVENISFNNVQLGYGTSGEFDLKNDSVPENEKGYTYPLMYGTDLPSFGLYLRHVKNVTMNNVNFIPAPNETRPALYLDNVMQLKATNVLYDFAALEAGQIIKNKTKNLYINELKLEK